MFDSLAVARDTSSSLGGRFTESSAFGGVGDYPLCGCCGQFHSVSDVGPANPVAALLNAFDRGGAGSNGKPSLTPGAAGEQLTRTGLSWSSLGQPAVVTFAFRSIEPTTMPTDTAGFTRFNQQQVEATLLALRAWSDVANITFNRVDDGDGYSNNATMLFGNYSSGQSGAAAFAYLPGNPALTSASGDVWINSSLSYNANPVALGYGSHTLAHEIGHAIGLSHPAAYNASEGVSITYAKDATYFEDSRQYTLMSYFSESNTGAAFGGRYSAVPLLDDIMAAQRLYGANMTTRTGDTTYGFDSNADRPWFTATSGGPALIFAVWDAGGINTFDFSGYSQSQVIDLRQGAFSNVGGLIGNVAIAMGTNIHNAIGGSGRDYLIGNALDNRLLGGAGDDLIRHGGGSNFVDGGSGVDTLIAERSADTYYFQRTDAGWLMYDGARNVNTLMNMELVSVGEGGSATSIEDYASRSFDAYGYLASYSDLRNVYGSSTGDAYRHFITNGQSEGRRTDVFDALRYVASNDDLVRTIGTDTRAAAEHYIKAGISEGRQTQSFNGLIYAASHVDLARAFGDNIQAATRHYITNGLSEGRSTNLFNPLIYAASYQDLALAFGTNTEASLLHYLRNGLSEGRSISVFDPLRYTASHLDLALAFGLNSDAALQHYLKNGASENRSISTFDSLLYTATYIDLILAFGTDSAAATRHYITNGASESRAISGFDAVAYLLTYGDLAGRSASEALKHWVTEGARAGRAGDSVFGRDQGNHNLTASGATGAVDQAGERDWYQLNLTAGQRITLDLAGAGAGRGTLGDGVLMIYDAFGRLIATDDNSGPGQDARLTFTATGSGVYYVVVAGVGSSAGTYQLSFTTGGAGELQTLPAILVAADVLDTPLVMPGLIDDHLDAHILPALVDDLGPQVMPIAFDEPLTAPFEAGGDLIGAHLQGFAPLTGDFALTMYEDGQVGAGPQPSPHLDHWFH